jgi:hypothetical protein
MRELETILWVITTFGWIPLIHALPISSSKYNFDNKVWVVLANISENLINECYSKCYSLLNTNNNFQYNRKSEKISISCNINIVTKYKFNYLSEIWKLFRSFKWKAKLYS